MTKQGRGALTRRVADKSKEMLGREITLTELRLMPYIQYELMNNRRVSVDRMNGDEISVLNDWLLAGWLTELSPLKTSKKFYDAMCEILYLAYVDIN